MDAPMLPDLPAIGGCPNCGHTYWFEDAEEIGEIELFAGEASVPTEWEATPEPITLDEEKVLDAIDDGMATTTEKERYLRLMAWHAFNDQFRGDEHHGEDPQPDERQEKNMKEIEELLFDSNECGDRFISADVARQLGEFQKAKNILNHIPPEAAQRRKDFLMKLCTQESRIVRRLPKSDEESF